MVRVGTLSCHGGVRLPGFRNEAEEFNQCRSQHGTAEFSRSPAAWARHCVIRILIVINRKHRNEHIKMSGVFDVAAGWVFSWFGYWLANWRLHFVGDRIARVFG